jgi:hypothetical protein
LKNFELFGLFGLSDFYSNACWLLHLVLALTMIRKTTHFCTGKSRGFNPSQSPTLLLPVLLPRVSVPTLACTWTVHANSILSYSRSSKYEITKIPSFHLIGPIPTLSSPFTVWYKSNDPCWIRYVVFDLASPAWAAHVRTNLRRLAWLVPTCTRSIRVVL